MPDQMKLNEMQARIRKETEEFIKEGGDLVDEISKDYAQLSALPEAEATSAVTTIVTNIALENIKLPWYMPELPVRMAIGLAIKTLAARKKQ